MISTEIRTMHFTQLWCISMGYAIATFVFVDASSKLIPEYFDDTGFNHI